MEDIKIIRGSFRYPLSEHHSVTYDGVFCICPGIFVDKDGEKINLIMEYCHMNTKKEPNILIHLTRMEFNPENERWESGAVEGSRLRASLTLDPYQSVEPSIRGLFRLIVKEIERSHADLIDFSKPVEPEIGIWRMHPSFIEKVLDVPFSSYIRLASEADPDKNAFYSAPEDPEQEEIQIPESRILQIVEFDLNQKVAFIAVDNEICTCPIKNDQCTIVYPDGIYKIRYNPHWDKFSLAYRPILIPLNRHAERDLSIRVAVSKMEKFTHKLRERLAEK